MNSSPYLEAIQNVAGSTPGEKYKTLNSIARKLIIEAGGKSDKVKIKPSSELPEILIPFVKLEIGKYFRQPDKIVEGLLSNDNLIFHRALQTKWFFNERNKNIININYFHDRIFKYISLKNLNKIIKKLSIYLSANEKHEITAESFYTTLLNLYGIKVAEPLLYACSRTFIWDEIEKKQLSLSIKSLNKLYHKFPYIAITYIRLKVSCADESYSQYFNANLSDYYIEFIPRLVKKNPDVYVELIEKYSKVGRKLTRTCTDKFLKYGTEDLIQRPNKFISILNLKSITSKLTKEQFKVFFRNLFPVNSTKINSEFSFMEMYNYLEYYHPKDNKVSFILSTFEKVYKESFLNYDNLIGPEVLRLLSVEDRVKIARKKLEKNSHWQIYNDENLEESWRCYLPINESISMIKDEILNRSKVGQRLELLKQLIYTCKVNNDEDALLKVLEYLEAKHNNEFGDVLLRIIERLLNDFQIQNLSIQHWKILDNIIKLLHIKDELLLIPQITVELIIAKIHFCLINNLPINKSIKFLFDIKKNEEFFDWNILKHHTEYERKCLEEFINIAPSFHLKNKQKTKLINSFLYAINNFNERHLKNNCEIKPMTVKSYLWLLADISKLINIDHDDYVDALQINLKKSNPDLYYSLVIEKENDKMINLKSSKEFHEWIKNPDKISNHWEKYLDQCKNDIHKKYAQRFIKNCRWHQNLPIKFAEKCLKDVSENGNPNALMVLALLYEGSTFERIIDPFLPAMNSSIDIKSKSAKKNYSIMKSIPEAIPLVNPPVSLNIITRFCEINKSHKINNCLTIFSHQTPVDKLILFTREMFWRPDSIAKYFIKNFQTLANTEDINDLLTDLWDASKSDYLRRLLFNTILKVFLKNSKPQTWQLLCTCIRSLTTNDKKQLISLCCFDKVSKEYIVNYVKEFLMKLKNWKREDNTVDIKFTQTHIIKLLRIPISIAVHFDEEVHQIIISRYFGNPFLPLNILEAAQYYLAKVYINLPRKKLQSRLKYFAGLFSSILKHLWGISNPIKTYICPANYLVDSMMIGLLSYMKNNYVRRQFIYNAMKIFMSILNPVQAPVFYSYYMFVALYDGEQMSKKDYVKKIEKFIPIFLRHLGVGFFYDLGKILSQSLEIMWENESRADVNFEIIEALLQLDNEHAVILASGIQIHEKIEQNRRYKNIIGTFNKRRNLAVTARNLMNFNRCGFEKESFIS
ncbi:hypothetical protein PV325_006224 [Microctonus aethiopoides]|nr:hypothetical protein PV325_006224 [Microctonus aethiopoides]